MKRTKKGFTLVELLVVIAILAILASVSVVGYTAFIERADKSVASQELHQIATLINAELLDDGVWSFKVDSTEYTLKVNDAGTALVVPDNFDAMIAAYADFASIKGEFTLTTEGKLSYKPEGQTFTVEETINF